MEKNSFWFMLFTKNHFQQGVAGVPSYSYFGYMSTLLEIQKAVDLLPDSEKKALSIWLNSQTEPEMNHDEEQLLLRSLDKAIRDLDAGKGVPIDDVRKRIASWASK
jgi:hypothetical protein